MQPQWDIFLVCADEDTEAAKQLDEALRQHELNCYPKISQLKSGDSLRRAVDDGLSQASHVVVLLSRNFFAKRWTQFELSALTRSEPDASQVVSILHDMTRDQVARFVPGLADRVVVSARQGVHAAAEELSSRAQAQRNDTAPSKTKSIYEAEQLRQPVDSVRLRRVLSEYFSLSDLETLSFDLGIDPDNLEGQTLSAKAMSLVQYCVRRSMTPRLIDAIRAQRPNVSI